MLTIPRPLRILGNVWSRVVESGVIEYAKKLMEADVLRGIQA